MRARVRFLFLAAVVAVGVAPAAQAQRDDSLIRDAREAFKTGRASKSRGKSAKAREARPAAAAAAPVVAPAPSPAEPPPAPAPPPKPEVPPDAPTAVARLDRTEAQIGDRLTLTVTTVAAAGVPTNLPTELDLSPFEVLAGDPVIEEKDLGDGHRSRSFRVEIAAYETGELTVPAIPVTYIGKDGRVLSRPTEPVPIKITSLIANEPDPQLKEPAAPITVLEEDLTLVFLGAGLLVAAISAFVALELRRRWRLRAAERPAPPPRPAHELALEKLGRLATSGLRTDSDLRLFYFQLSEIMREYLGGRFGFLALEMTTEEVVGEIARRAPRGLLPGELAGWLAGCDLVKFAKLAPPPSEARGALETAIRMVEATRPRPEPVAASGSAERRPPERGAGEEDAHGG
jgi:BatD DUF11 like domain